jgi:hypothetical protein
MKVRGVGPRRFIGVRVDSPGRYKTDRAAIDLCPRVGDDRWSDATLNRLTWAFIALGVTIRLVRLLLVHPLWGDECFVAANLIDRGYLGLLRPLDYQQVVPVLFLWAELSFVKLAGFSEWSLRLFPTLCAIAGLFVFRHLAGRLMKGMPLLMGVAIVAVSLNPIRHGGEAKPYAVDFLASTVLLALLVEWWRRPGRATWLWVLAGSTPIVMGFSLPSVFVLGGISLAILGRVGKGREPGLVAAYLAFNLAIVGGVGATLALNRGAGSVEIKAYMDHYWSAMFPPLSDPVGLVSWLVRAHTGHLFAYPAGGANGASLVTCGLAVAGWVDLRRRGRGTIALASVAPLGLALLASALRIYPYGESERLMQFEGPMICLLSGYGLAWSIGRFRYSGSYRKVAVFSLVGFGLIGLGSIVVDLVHPCKTPGDLRAREFARWFWTEAGRNAELACARVDLGLDFEGGSPHYGRSADYLTYQKIYSTRHRQGRPLDWSGLTEGHPLRCVLSDGVPDDLSLFEPWMRRMARHYRLARVVTYRVNSGLAPKSVSYEDKYVVLEFVPIGVPVDPAELARGAVAEADRPARGSLTLPGP